MRRYCIDAMQLELQNTFFLKQLHVIFYGAAILNNDLLQVKYHRFWSAFNELIA